MLVKNTKPRVIGIGTIYLIPGVNEVDDNDWLQAKEKGYARAISGLSETGEIEIIGKEEASKPTMKIVSETYDTELLKRWLVNAKGRLKGAIKDQIDLIEEVEETEEAV